MKPILYALLFTAIVGVMGFAYFATMTPNVSQQVVTKVLPPKDAFSPSRS